MTAGELIEHLSQFDPGIKVVTDNPDIGFDEIKVFRFIRATYSPKDFYGDYQLDHNGEAILLLSCEESR